MLAETPKSPYYAVIFTSQLSETLTNEELQLYSDMGNEMDELAKTMPGYLGIESARGEGINALGITVSYWKDRLSILNWKNNVKHRFAQDKGKSLFYRKFTTRVCKVEHEYGSE